MRSPLRPVSQLKVQVAWVCLRWLKACWSNFATVMEVDEHYSLRAVGGPLLILLCPPVCPAWDFADTPQQARPCSTASSITAADCQLSCSALA